MKQALLLIDIQNDYFHDGRMELIGMEKAAENAQRVLELFRKNNLPVFHVQHLANREGATFFLPETDGALIHSSVKPQDGESIILKHFPSAFRETSLLEQLQSLGAKELVIGGAMTHMCIDTTVRAAFDLGFSCLLLSDCCATRDLEFKGIVVEASEVQAAFMAALASVFARVITSDDLQKHLEST
jgi:nicotinamidase-related amidase